MADEAEAPTEQPEAATFTVPTDLSTLDDARLEELTSAVFARGAELAARDTLDDDELAEGIELGQVADGLEAEIEARATAATERAELAASTFGRFATATATADPDEDESDEVQAGAEADLETDDETDPAASTTKGEPVAKEPEAVTASAPKRPTSFRGASPAFVQGKSTAKAPKKEAAGEFMIASAFARDPEGTQYHDTAEVAKALWKKRMAFGNIPHGTNEMLTIATGTKVFEEGTPTVGLDAQQNLISLRDVQEAGLVASGAFCTPQTQLYNFFRLAVPIRDVEDSIPTVQAPRGGIRHIAANCAIAGAAAIGRYTYDPATPGGPDSEDPTFEKPCDRVACPEIDESLVEAITQCTVFDNLEYRTFPELIENFMEDVAVQFTLRKQRFYLDRIDAASTPTSGIGSYGAIRSLFYDWTVAAQGYRKRHHMPRGAPLTLLAPDWAVDVIKSDMFNDGDNGLDYLNVPDSVVTAGLASRNLNVTWYYDDATSFMAGNPLTTAQAGGGALLNDYPSEVVSFLYSPGTFVKLDGGSLDLGLVRDHTLNRSNDFAMFLEEWLGFAMLGCESVRIDSVVCPSGARAGYAAALRTCVDTFS